MIRTESIDDVNQCRDDPSDKSNWVQLEWKVLSSKPKIMELKNCLSDFESDHIINIAKPKLNTSSTGGGNKNAKRKSQTAWVSRESSEVIDWIHRRFADFTNIDENHIWNNIGSEQFQVVYYTIGDEYKSHHDWHDKRQGMRFFSFLMYLNDRESISAGGETYFEKIGLAVHPGKGSCILFYDILPDGNVDDLTLHAALPVKQGEKWLANLWVWDPMYVNFNA